MKKLWAWVKDFIEPKCECCGLKYVQLRSIGELLLCERCDAIDMGLMPIDKNGD